MFNINIFAERVKELRKQNYLKQDDVGKAINLTIATISRIESGDRSVSMDTLIALADYFNVSLDYLVGRSEVKERR